MTTLNINQTYTFPDSIVENIFALTPFKGDLEYVNTEDGQGTDYRVEIILNDGLTMKPLYVLNHVFHGGFEDFEDGSYYVDAITKAENMIEKIKSKGVINLQHWTKIINKG